MTGQWQDRDTLLKCTKPTGPKSDTQLVQYKDLVYLLLCDICSSVFNTFRYID